MFYVYYNSGSCNFGDHDSGLEEFPSLEAALEFIEEKKKHWDIDGSWCIIRGEILEDGKHL